MTPKQKDTPVAKIIKKMRTRYLLPMEMVAFITLAVVGVSGGLGGGYLWRALALPGDAEPAQWLFSLGTVGILGLVVSAAEWWEGEGWENGRLRRWIYTRMWLSGLAVVMWLYATYEMMVIGERHMLVTIIMSAVAISPFHLWSWWVNYRTHCVLNPHLRTSKLEARLEANRHRW